MFLIHSDLSCKTYLSCLKEQFSSPFSIFRERVTGFSVGPFFSIAYYSPYEWNRRITNECNRAWGYVKEVDGKSQIHYIQGKGLFSPFWILFVYLSWLILFFLFGLNQQIPLGELFVWQVWVMGAVVSLAICAVTAFQSSITEAGIAGEYEIEKLIAHPEDYYV